MVVSSILVGKGQWSVSICFMCLTCVCVGLNFVSIAIGVIRAAHTQYVFVNFVENLSWRSLLFVSAHSPQVLAIDHATICGTAHRGYGHDLVMGGCPIEK